MLTCDLCGGPRINGAAVAPVDSDDRAGPWHTVPRNYPGALDACRACARAVVSGDWATVDARALARTDHRPEGAA